MTNQSKDSMQEGFSHSGFSINIWLRTTPGWPIFLFSKSERYNTPPRIVFFLCGKQVGGASLLLISWRGRKDFGKWLVVFYTRRQSCNHIILWYPLAYKIWTMNYRLLGNSWLMIGSVREETWAWRGISRGKNSPLWIVWKERN